MTSAIPLNPRQNWKKASSYNDALSELVAGGNIDHVRDYFDKVFWEGRKERPEWEHMRIAVLREDRAMVRLLHTWGAEPSDEDLARFRLLAQDKYDGYLKIMRAAGLRPKNLKWEEIAAAKPSAVSGREETFYEEITGKRDDSERLKKIPSEWTTVLGGFHASGANEAVIAGGSLRDLFNARAIKDVDIFLRDRGSQKKNRKLIEAAFAQSGVDVKEQVVSEDSYGKEVKKFPDPLLRNETATTQGVRRTRQMQSWRVVAGPAKTLYNVIFIDDSLDRQLSANATAAEQRSIFTGGLLEAFDLGLCQIASDGKEIVSTPAYKDDVKHKRITLVNPDTTTDDHLKRITDKYADWEQTAEVKKALKPKKPAFSASRGYSSFS
ncbi:MAG: hypothetical protein ACAH80_05175 [Alphaproteobacteria bacterium]